MSPFQQLFGSVEFWSAVILALIGGGGIGGLVGAWSNSRKNEADIDSITADAADKAVKILTDSIISPLREQVAYQEEQIRHLEEVQRKYFTAEDRRPGPGHRHDAVPPGASSFRRGEESCHRGFVRRGLVRGR